MKKWKCRYIISYGIGVDRIEEIVYAKDMFQARRLIESRHAGDKKFAWSSYPTEVR